MTFIRKINDSFAVGLNHPSEGELEQLAKDGYRSVVNLRRAAEENQPLGPEEEGEAVRRLGMDYLHFPVAGDALGDSLVDEFRERVRSLATPVFVHCASGKRSGAFTMMHLAVEAGQSGEQVLKAAEAMGFQCDNEGLETFVRAYVDNQQV